MRRRGMAAMLISAAMLMAACGSGEDKTSKDDKKKETEQTQQASEGKDIQSVGEEIVEQCTFSKELTQVDQEVVGNYITIEDGVSAVMWMTDGATAEEVAVFETPDESTADQQMMNVQMYLEDQKTSFEDYIPEEVKRIDEAVISISGNTLVLCVSDDASKAADVVESAIN